MEKETKKPHRVQIYEWKVGKVLPRPNTVQEIKDEDLKEEVALIAIRKYLPFVKRKNKLLNIWKETK